MTFEKISKLGSCSCLLDSNEDTSSEFVRKIAGIELDGVDFENSFDRGADHTKMSCPQICSNAGISINKITSDSLPKILEKYKVTFHINPAQCKYYVRFRFLPKAGVVKHTPNKNDPFHYDLYKADGFTINSISIVSTNPII